MPIAGLIPCAFWNSASVVSAQTSVPEAACALSPVEHTTLASRTAPTFHLHAWFMQTSWLDALVRLGLP